MQSYTDRKFLYVPHPVAPADGLWRYHGSFAWHCLPANLRTSTTWRRECFPVFSSVKLCFPLSQLSSLEASHHYLAPLGWGWSGKPGTQHHLRQGAVPTWIIWNSTERKISLTPTLNEIQRYFVQLLAGTNGIELFLPAPHSKCDSTSWKWHRKQQKRALRGGERKVSWLGT